MTTDRYRCYFVTSKTRYWINTNPWLHVGVQQHVLSWHSVCSTPSVCFGSSWLLLWTLVATGFKCTALWFTVKQVTRWLISPPIQSWGSTIQGWALTRHLHQQSPYLLVIFLRSSLCCSRSVPPMSCSSHLCICSTLNMDIWVSFKTRSSVLHMRSFFYLSHSQCIWFDVWSVASVGCGHIPNLHVEAGCVCHSVDCCLQELRCSWCCGTCQNLWTIELVFTQFTFTFTNLHLFGKINNDCLYHNCC